MIKPLFLALALVTSLSLSQPTTRPCPYPCEDCTYNGYCKTCLKSFPYGGSCGTIKDTKNCLIIYTNARSANQATPWSQRSRSLGAGTCRTP